MAAALLALAAVLLTLRRIKSAAPTINKNAMNNSAKSFHTRDGLKCPSFVTSASRTRVAIAAHDRVVFACADPEPSLRRSNRTIVRFYVQSEQIFKRSKPKMR